MMVRRYTVQIIVVFTIIIGQSAGLAAYENRDDGIILLKEDTYGYYEYIYLTKKDIRYISVSGSYTIADDRHALLKRDQGDKMFSLIGEKYFKLNGRYEGVKEPGLVYEDVFYEADVYKDGRHKNTIAHESNIPDPMRSLVEQLASIVPSLADSGRYGYYIKASKMRLGEYQNMIGKSMTNREADLFIKKERPTYKVTDKLILPYSILQRVIKEPEFFIYLGENQKDIKFLHLFKSEKELYIAEDNTLYLVRIYSREKQP